MAVLSMCKGLSVKVMVFYFIMIAVEVLNYTSLSFGINENSNAFKRL